MTTDTIIGDIDTTQALWLFILAGVCIIAAVYFAITEIRYEWRERKRRRVTADRVAAFAALIETGPIVISQAIADGWTRDNVRVTRFGDKRYRDGEVSQVLAR